MTSNKKVHVITMDNLRDNELFELIKGLNEISGFDFSIDTFVMIKNDQIPHMLILLEFINSSLAKED